jgi:hypothetical protein
VTFALLLVAALVGLAPEGSAATTGTITAWVRHTNASMELKRLPNVEVFLYAGGPHYACTDLTGHAVFTDIPAGGPYFMATGIGVSGLNCQNGEFLQPNTRLKLFMVAQGGVMLGSGESITVEFNTGQPPANQDEICGGVTADVVGTPGDDVLIGTPDADVISGGGGRDTIKGYGGNDILCGGPGRDKIYGGAGSDMIFGEGGDDSGGLRGLFGGAGEDVAVYGGGGIDLCEGELTRGCELP